MTLNEFRSRSKYVQQLIVKHHGVFLSQRKSTDQDILLFQIDGFYVEVAYERRSQKATLLQSFDDLDQLEPYLQKINVLTLMD